MQEAIVAPKESTEGEEEGEEEEEEENVEDAQELLDGIKESMEQNAGDAQRAGGARAVPGFREAGCRERLQLLLWF